MCASAPALKPIYLRYVGPSSSSSAYARTLTTISRVTGTPHASVSQARIGWGSRKPSASLSSVEMGIVVKTEVDQVVVVEKSRPSTGNGEAFGREDGIEARLVWPFRWSRPGIWRGLGGDLDVVCLDRGVL
jgi:hypothetical protein